MDDNARNSVRIRKLQRRWWIQVRMTSSYWASHGPYFTWDEALAKVGGSR